MVTSHISPEPSHAPTVTHLSCSSCAHPSQPTVPSSAPRDRVPYSRRGRRAPAALRHSKARLILLSELTRQPRERSAETAAVSPLCQDTSSVMGAGPAALPSARASSLIWRPLSQPAQPTGTVTALLGPVQAQLTIKGSWHCWEEANPVFKVKRRHGGALYRNTRTLGIQASSVCYCLFPRGTARHSSPEPPWLSLMGVPGMQCPQRAAASLYQSQAQ